MRKIGILGGTFDPVHNGHIILAQEAKRQVGLDKVIFMPAKLQPFKLDKKVTAPEHRLAMLRLAIEGLAGFEISEYEMNSQNISYTYHTLRAMCQLYTGDEIYFITGTDAFLKIKYWKNAKEVLTQYNIIVGVRPGHKEEELAACIEEMRQVYNTNIIKVNGPMLDISSTEVRANLKKELIPSAVERYMKEHEFY